MRQQQPDDTKLSMSGLKINFIGRIMPKNLFLYMLTCSHLNLKGDLVAFWFCHNLTQYIYFVHAHSLSYSLFCLTPEMRFTLMIFTFDAQRNVLCFCLKSQVGRDFICKGVRYCISCLFAFSFRLKIIYKLWNIFLHKWHWEWM